MNNLANSHREISGRNNLNGVFLLFLCVAVVFTASCSSGKNEGEGQSDLVVVKSPVDGVIKRVLVSEGAQIQKDAGIVEIDVLNEIENAPEIDKRNDPVADENRKLVAQQLEAEENVKRTSIEVERVALLVASNSASQSQLDAARAEFHKAQERLEEIMERARKQKTKNLIKQNSHLQGQTRENIAAKVTVTARSNTHGVLKALSERAGQTVKTGQVLATVSPR